MDARAYSNLFERFLEGFLRHRTPLGAGASYPGLPSNNGAAIDRVEGFSRTAPLWAAWIAGGRPHRIRLASGVEADLPLLIREGILAGTSPSSPEYWGRMRGKSQLIVEAADVALTAWLTRNTVWSELPADRKAQVADWLRQAERLAVRDNNWHLWPVLVSAVLRALDLPSDSGSSRNHYLALKRFYLGDGWFSDGTPRRVDYYNAWAIHYTLWWLRQIDPEWDAEFLRQALEQFLSTYKYLIGPEGFPILGRSVCYRMAVAAPLVMAQREGSQHVPPGLARRALDATWTHFLRKGGVRDGNITQGYCGRADERVLDNYSGPASCLWGLRSLIPAFYLPTDHAFWTAPTEPLPVESADYSITIPTIGWTVVGNRAARRIEIRKDGSADEIPLADYRSAGRLASWILRRPVRPWNTAAKYRARVYSSDKPFCG